MKKGSKHSKETRERMRKAHMGQKSWNKGLHIKCSNGLEVWRNNGGVPWNKGKVCPQISENMSGERNHMFGLLGENSCNWKGDKIGYFGLHDWVRKELGAPNTCEHCRKKGLTGHKIHWANKSHTYKRILTDWLRLCVSCHKKYDKKYASI